jgi:hypothetical protein
MSRSDVDCSTKGLAIQAFGPDARTGTGIPGMRAASTLLRSHENALETHDKHFDEQNFTTKKCAMER